MAAPGVVQHVVGDGAPAMTQVVNPAVTVVGFKNEGNTCYLASTLQVLIHSTYVDTVTAITSAPLRDIVTNYRDDADSGTYTRVDDHTRYTKSLLPLRDELVTLAHLGLGIGTQEDPRGVWEHLLGLQGLDQQFELQVRRRYTVPNAMGPGVTDGVRELDAQGWTVVPDIQDQSLVMIPPGGQPTLAAALRVAARAFRVA